MDKDYNAVLRTALTSINKVNKTDVETLRSSLGSFADIARAPSDRLQTLPGFGPVKVRRIKDAFDKPFRNRATSAVFSVGSQVPRGAGDEVVSTSNGENVLEVAESKAASGSKAISDSGPAQIGVKGKGKGKESAQRSPSPVWDIELDLDSPPPAMSSGSPPPRELSSVCDIELDLNDDSDDLYVDPRLAAKKGFGRSGSLLGPDE